MKLDLDDIERDVAASGQCGRDVVDGLIAEIRSQRAGQAQIAQVFTFTVQPTVCGGCGHKHGGADVGFICIGCPCPERMGAVANVEPARSSAATVDLNDAELNAAETLIDTLERLNVRAAVDTDAMQAARLLHRMAAEIRRRRSSSKRIRELVSELNARGEPIMVLDQILVGDEYRYRDRETGREYAATEARNLRVPNRVEYLRGRR